MNQAMQECRDVAIDLLKPSSAELEHGLELHSQLLVIDGYGFAPRPAIDGNTVREASLQGASETELHWLTENMFMTRYVTAESERQELAHAWDAAGVDCIFQNAAEDGPAIKTLLPRLAHFIYGTDMAPDLAIRAVTPEGIVQARQQDARCLYLSANGVPLLEERKSVQEELAFIEVFFQLGIRMMHLTYNRRNQLGDGCAESANAGLSDFGRQAIAEMNRVGVIVDVAHSGWQTSLEAAQCSQSPVVASHTSCSALADHCRCKPDDVIKAIADSGGCVGICCIPAFLGGTGDINAFLDHIDHVAGTVGTDHVSIGTDVAYESVNAEAEREKVPSRPPCRQGWSIYWPPDDTLDEPEWNQPHQLLSLAWTNWPIFTVGLVKRGYSDKDIEKILGGNILRVARSVMQTT